VAFAFRLCGNRRSNVHKNQANRQLVRHDASRPLRTLRRNGAASSTASDVVCGTVEALVMNTANHDLFSKADWQVNNSLNENGGLFLGPPFFSR
jgi:hypothetical protein